MSYRIEAVELFVRETRPGRMAFALGKMGGIADFSQGQTNPLGHVRLAVRDSAGGESFGCAGDRLVADGLAVSRAARARWTAS